MRQDHKSELMGGNQGTDQLWDLVNCGSGATWEPRFVLGARYFQILLKGKKIWGQYRNLETVA